MILYLIFKFNGDYIYVSITYCKKQYIFNVSDIHFEIDMSLLGCHAKMLFNDIYYHILDILSA